MKAEKKSTLKDFLKDDIRQETNFRSTDQNNGVPMPAIEKAAAPDARMIPLPEPEALEIGPISLKEAISHRESRRKFTAQSVTLEELSFLLWSTQGVRVWRQQNALRTVPSAGNRHALETYLACEAIGAGTCAIAAYNQQSADQLLKVDGEKEFVVYMAPVGKI